jgi:hypothetical protein
MPTSKKPQNVLKETYGRCENISEEYSQGALQEHPFEKNQFQFGLVIMLQGYGTGAVVPCGDEEIMLCEFLQRAKRNAASKYL